MKKHAIIFASLALSCLVLSAPLAAGAVSLGQTETSSLYIITVQPELPVTERSELELTALEMTQTWQNPNPRRQLALKSVSRAGCSVYQWSSSAPAVASVDASGLVTALAPGKAVIHAYTTQGETLTCTWRVHRNGHCRDRQSHAGCRCSSAAQRGQPAGPDPHCGCAGALRCGTAMDKLCPLRSRRGRQRHRHCRG